MSEVTFTLNDAPVTAAYAGKETLLQYLRNVKCLKGTKEACGTGHCGACSVLIDGKLARSCVTPLRTLAGKHVETIEIAAKDGALSVIQRSFLDAGAVQCGFCTPGMVMATKALLLRTLSPTEGEIYDGLRHNYCRCTGYVKIIEAVKLAAARLRGQGVDLRPAQAVQGPRLQYLRAAEELLDFRDHIRPGGLADGQRPDHLPSAHLPMVWTWLMEPYFSWSMANSCSS